MNSPRQHAAADRAGHSLLELIAAGFLLTMTLVPALRMLADSLDQGQRTETLMLLNTFAVSKLEEYLGKTVTNWSATSASGTFAAEGYANLRFVVTRSQSPSAGGRNNRLMVITATVWNDVNANGTLDSGEPVATMATKLAKLTKYPNGTSS